MLLQNVPPVSLPSMESFREFDPDCVYNPDSSNNEEGNDRRDENIYEIRWDAEL